MLTKDFILAGNAIFTVTSPELDTGRPELDTGHQTYRVRLVHFEDDLRDWYFVDLLTGPDNTHDYTYLGRLDKSSGRLLRTSKSPAWLVDAVLWSVLEEVTFAVWSGDWTGKALEDVEVAHAGKCGRCGRLLTDPESIELGIGPVCRGALGVST